VVDLQTGSLVAIFAIFTIAGIVKGVTGMGLPTVAMGMLGFFMSPVAAAGMLILPSFITNIWQLLSGPHLKATLLRLWPMMIAIVAGTLIGIRLMTGGAAVWTTSALPGTLEKWLSAPVGFITGLLTGGTGVFVVPAVPYIQSLGFQRDDLVQALGLSFTVSTMALALGLASQSALQTQELTISALAVIPALLGMWAGQKIRHIVSPTTFRRWFLICLLILGCELFLRAFWH